MTMRFSDEKNHETLLTSAGISNQSIRNALVDLLAKPSDVYAVHAKKGMCQLSIFAYCSQGSDLLHLHYREKPYPILVKTRRKYRLKN